MVQQFVGGVAHRVDAVTSDYRLATHRQSKAVGESIREREDQLFIDAVTDPYNEWNAGRFGCTVQGDAGQAANRSNRAG